MGTILCQHMMGKISDDTSWCIVNLLKNRQAVKKGAARVKKILTAKKWL